MTAPAGAAGAAGREGVPPAEDAAARAHRSIRQAIMARTFQPGQHLQEVFLADWLGISRTPVRDALRRLQVEGLVEPAARGVVVAQVTVEGIEQAYQLLEVLEGLAARLAAARLDDEGAAALRDILGQMDAAVAAGDGGTWAALDAQLHDAIRGASGSPKLAEMVSRVYPVIERVRNTYLLEGTDAGRLAAVAAVHREMGEAVLARDPDRAEALARRTFAEGGQANVRLLRRWVAPLRHSF